MRTGAGRRGPSSVNSTSRPIASSGTSRSENRIAASNPKRRIGCSVTSAASFGVLHSSRKLTPARTCAVLGQVAPGLAHHPERRALGGLAAAGAQEEGLHRAGVYIDVRLVDVIRRVLLVDDDQGLRTVLAAALGDEGFVVTQARNGLEGLRRFEATAPTW